MVYSFIAAGLVALKLINLIVATMFNVTVFYAAPAFFRWAWENAPIIIDHTPALMPIVTVLPLVLAHDALASINDFIISRARPSYVAVAASPHLYIMQAFNSVRAIAMANASEPSFVTTAAAGSPPTTSFAAFNGSTIPNSPVTSGKEVVVAQAPAPSATTEVILQVAMDWVAENIACVLLRASVAALDTLIAVWYVWLPPLFALWFCYDARHEVSKQDFPTAKAIAALSRSVRATREGRSDIMMELSCNSFPPGGVARLGPHQEARE